MMHDYDTLQLYIIQVALLSSYINTPPAPVLQIPGLLSCPYLTDDRVHPHDLISHHAKELQLVRLRGDPHPALLAVRQQLLPALHHLVFAARDGLSLLTSVHCPQLHRALLQLTHLAGRDGGRESKFEDKQELNQKEL